MPEEVQVKWCEWISTLPAITQRSIPRRITLNESPVVFRTLHGSSDASFKTYGAAVYIRHLHQDKTVSVSLVMAIAGVLSIKAITIPKAELIAAHLLAKLLSHVSDVLQIFKDKLFAWTDSMIVLCWLQKPPSVLKTFVANRVSVIQELLPSSHWRHVTTDQNPADLLSRGLNTSSLIKCTLWWKGPPWLLLTPQQWPSNELSQHSQLPEVEVSELCWDNFSSFHTLNRTVAWMRRFIKNYQHPLNKRVCSEILQPRDVQCARLHLLRLAQRHSYKDVFEALHHHRSLPKRHNLARMEISLDSDGLLKISSRIRNTASPKTSKQLIPLSLQSTLTRLLVKTLHKSHSHPGVEALLSIIGDTSLIPSLRNYLKKFSRDCPICQRAYAKPQGQQMGLLQLSRTTPAPPFMRTGVNFAGPFHIKKGHTHKPVLVKSYSCLFVCLTTKAVHLELCAELSMPEFMAALQRFTARRGSPADIFSDNGTNSKVHSERYKNSNIYVYPRTLKLLSHIIVRGTLWSGTSFHLVHTILAVSRR